MKSLIISIVIFSLLLPWKTSLEKIYVSSLVPADSSIYDDPFDVAVDEYDNVYVSFVKTYNILKYSPDGVVSTISTPTMPYGLAIAKDGSIFYAGYSDHKIFKIFPNGSHMVWAGSGEALSRNGQGISAAFNTPLFITLDVSGNLYVSEENGNKISKISPSRLVSTAISSASGWVQMPAGIDMDTAGNIYISDRGRKRILKMTSTGAITATYGTFVDLYGLGLDKQKNIYLSDIFGNVIKRIKPDSNLVDYVAGTPEGVYQDGPATSAGFNLPCGLRGDSKGNVYVADRGTDLIRKISFCKDDMVFENSNCQCTAGNELNSTLNACQLCPLGKYKASIGNQNCMDCPIGTESNTDRSACTACPTNKYRSDLKIQTCIDCPLNSACSPSGVSCFPGYQLSDSNNVNTTCDLCPLGFFKNNTSNLACQPCPEGTESSPDRTKCTDCNSGFYRPSLDILSCIACPKNSQCSISAFDCLSGFNKDDSGTICIPILLTTTESSVELSTLLEITRTSAILELSTFTRSLEIPPLSRTRSTGSSKGSRFDSNSSTNGFTFTWPYIMLIGSALIMIAGCSVVVFKYKRILSSKEFDFDGETAVTKSNSKSVLTHSSSFVTTMSHSSGMSSSRITSVTSLNSPSAINNSSITIKGRSGLCVPAFLLFQAGLDFRKETKLAEGGLGSVWTGQAFNPLICKYGKRVVIKESKCNMNSQNILDAFYQEISIMYMLKDHKNIAKFLGYSDKPYSILMKFYPNGSLSNFLFDRSRVKTKRMQARFNRNISKGMGFMVSKGIAHCDLKTDNILIDVHPETKEMFCVITDYGISCLTNSNSLTVDGFRVVELLGASLFYASPESISRFKGYPCDYNYHPWTSDLYSFAMIINEILTRRVIWNR